MKLLIIAVVGAAFLLGIWFGSLLQRMDRVPAWAYLAAMAAMALILTIAVAVLS